MSTLITHLTLRHRTASGGATHSIWEFDPVRRVVECIVRMASAKPVGLTVWVCSSKTPRFGAHIVTRIDVDTWRVSRAAYLSHDLARMPRTAAHHENLPPVDLVLTHAPEDISDELSRL